MKKYAKYLIEFVVIVFGITASFMVDEWREERQDRKELKNILQMMQSNLQQDSIKMINVADFMLRRVSRIDNFIDKKGDVHDSLKLKYFYDLVYSSYSFHRRYIGYNILSTSSKSDFGNNGLLESIELYYGHNRAINFDEYHRIIKMITDLSIRKFASLHVLRRIQNASKTKNDLKSGIVLEDNMQFYKDLNDFLMFPELLNLASEKGDMEEIISSEIEYLLKINNRLRLEIQQELQD